MDARRFEELLSRWVSGDRLAPAEEQSLLDWMENHPDARKELLEDEALDSLLRCWPRLEGTAEDFVRDCLRRAVGEPVDQRERAFAVAVPPIVAIPVPAVRPLKTPGDARRSGRLFAGRASRWVAAMAACSAALLFGTIGWRWLSHGPRAVVTNRPAAPVPEIPAGPSDGSQGPRPEADRTFATLAQSTQAAWETPRTEGDRLAAGLLKLTAGTAELRFDKGTVARLTGPATLELRSGDAVFLKCGSLAARVPPPAVGFLVATPLSRIVDLGTEFDVTVDDSGATRTLVRRGRVSLRAQRGQEELGTPIELAVGALDRAAVSVPDIAAPVLPVTTVARGSEGRFLGRMSANGKTAEFHSPTAFHEFKALTLKQLREAPRRFSEEWPALANGAGKGIKTEPKSAPEREESGLHTAGESHGVKAAPEGTPKHRESPSPNIVRSPPKTDVASGSRGTTGPGKGAGAQSIEVQENGKTIAISDSKESGITVTITELVGGKKKMTEVRAANPAELAKKNPEAHHLYKRYIHAHQKVGKPK
jgi:hypothetical protein